MTYDKQTWVNGEVITAEKLNQIEESPMEGIDPNYFLFIENDKVIIDFSCTAAIAEDPSAYVTSAHVEFYEA